MSAGDISVSQTPMSRRPLVIGAAVLVVVALLLVFASGRAADLRDFPASWNLGLRATIDGFQDWVIGNRATHPAFTYFFDPLRGAIDTALRRVEGFLLGLPWTVVVLAFALLGVGLGGLRLGLLSAVCLFVMGWMGLWAESMQTLALMSVSVGIALLLGIPLGIFAARHERFEATLRPLLDAMQTMPAFVYLIPVLLFFGVARVPAVVATVIFALPPAIRLTSLGIREVSPAAVEAAESFGSTPRQTLLKVQLPLAMPTIMAGVNQTIMMALGIVVIAALIGAGGLGREVLVSLQRLQGGKALEAGLGIVFLAVLLDRLSFALTRRDRTAPHHTAFRLLPESWAQYAPARAFEAALDYLARTGMRVARGITAVPALLFGPAGTPSPTSRAAAVRRWLDRHAFAIGGLLLLGAAAFSVAILPALTLSLITMGYVLRMVRAGVIEVANSEYVRIARKYGDKDSHKLINGVLDRI